METAIKCRNNKEANMSFVFTNNQNNQPVSQPTQQQPTSQIRVRQFHMPQGDAEI